MCSLRGLIYHVVIALGHNNDQGLFNRTMRDYISKANVVGLADRGYTHQHLLSPEKKPPESTINSDETWSKMHSEHRSTVEIVNAMVKCWKFASGKCSIGPEEQAMGLFIVYSLVNACLKVCPVRMFPRFVNK